MNNTDKSIAGLIEVAVQRHEASGRRLALMAQEHGFSISVATINAIRKGRYHSAPADDTLRAIAWLAGVPEKVAFTAAGQTVPGPPLGEELPPGADNLPPKARKAVIEYTRVLIDQQEQIRELTQQLKSAQADKRSRGGSPAREDALPGQKTGEQDQFTYTIRHTKTDAEVPEDLDLAAHPSMGLAADDIDRERNAAGEESQDSSREH